jgi:hypothetical protein
MLAPNYAAQLTSASQDRAEQGIQFARAGNWICRAGKSIHVPRLSKCMKIIFVVEYNQQLTPRLNKPVHPLYPARRAGGRDEAFIPGRPPKSVFPVVSP